MRRRNVEVDDRTAGMTLEALRCRRLGHSWIDLPIGKARRAELAGRGLSELIVQCERGTLRMIETVDLETWEVVSKRPDGGYPPGYLVPPGSGRLPRAEARKAYMVRRGLV